MTPPFRLPYDLIAPFAPFSATFSSTPKTPSAIRHRFTAHEDERLRALVGELGDGNWAEVATRLGTRSARQCRERFRNYLDPNLRQDPWSPAEDELLLQKFIELGSRWAEIGQFFAGRSEANIKNRWAQMQTKPGRGLALEVEHLDKIIANGHKDEDAKPPTDAVDLFTDEMFLPGSGVWDTGTDGWGFDFL
jgi:hypothetical protein